MSKGVDLGKDQKHQMCNNKNGLLPQNSMKHHLKKDQTPQNQRTYINMNVQESKVYIEHLFRPPCIATEKLATRSWRQVDQEPRYLNRTKKRKHIKTPVKTNANHCLLTHGQVDPPLLSLLFAEGLDQFFCLGQRA